MSSIGDGPCTKSRKFMGAFKNRVTLKALANVSPGRGPRAGSPHGVGVFALKPWVQKRPRRLFATLKGLRGFAVSKRRRNSFRVAPSRNDAFSQGCQNATPGWNWRTLSALFIFWAGISQRFQRYSFSDKSSQKWVAFRLFVQSPIKGLFARKCKRVKTLAHFHKLV